jgi:hypothetical protein
MHQGNRSDRVGGMIELDTLRSHATDWRGNGVVWMIVGFSALRCVTRSSGDLVKFGAHRFRWDKTEEQKDLTEVMQSISNLYVL